MAPSVWKQRLLLLWITLLPTIMISTSVHGFVPLPSCQRRYPDADLIFADKRSSSAMGCHLTIETAITRNHHEPKSFTKPSSSTRLEMISSGFSFVDESGDERLVSIQKPLGIVLEQEEEDQGRPILVIDVAPNGSASQAGVQVGDELVAVQNASCQGVDLDQVLAFIANGPRVLNIRLRRRNDNGAPPDLEADQETKPVDLL